MKAMRILVVEDDALIGSLLADLLGRMGHDVCAVEATAAGAVAAAIHFKPQMMIVDVILGGGSGIAAVDEITKTAAIPHVFVSGDTSAVQALRPASVSLRKPYREIDLTGAMKRALVA